MKVKAESEKVGLKLNIQKTKIMASGPITSWEIDGETVETVSDFILGGSKITADGDCSHEIKRRLLLEKKVMTHLDSILKSRDITLPTKVHLVKALVFPVIMYEHESWTVKKAECRRIGAFELWYWKSCAPTLSLLQPLPLLPELADSAGFKCDSAKVASLPFIVLWLTENSMGSSPKVHIHPTSGAKFLLNARP